MSSFEISKKVGIRCTWFDLSFRIWRRNRKNDKDEEICRIKDGRFLQTSGKSMKKRLEWYDPSVTPEWNERGDLVVLGLWRYVVRCSIFFFPLRPNLNLCSRDSCPYTDKGCMDYREERSRGSPPRTARIPRVNRKLDLHWISPESPHLSSWGGVWFQTPGSNRRSTPC